MLQKLYGVLDVAVRKQADDYDTVFCVTGRERVGKSTLMLHGMEYLNGKPEYISLDGHEFKLSLLRCAYKEKVVLDEAGGALFNREAMSRLTRDLIKIYQKIGKKNLITFLVLPSIFNLERYFASWRVNGLFHVYARSKYVFLSRPQILKCLKERKLSFNPRNHDYFPKYAGRMKGAYDKKKAEYLRKMERDESMTGPKELPKKEVISFLLNQKASRGVIAEICKVSRQYVDKVAKMATTQPSL